jgi:hypothetical protein
MTNLQEIDCTMNCLLWEVYYLNDRVVFGDVIGKFAVARAKEKLLPEYKAKLEASGATDVWLSVSLEGGSLVLASSYIAPEGKCAIMGTWRARRPS